MLRLQLRQQSMHHCPPWLQLHQNIHVKYLAYGFRLKCDSDSINSFIVTATPTPATIDAYTSLCLHCDSHSSYVDTSFSMSFPPTSTPTPGRNTYPPKYVSFSNVLRLHAIKKGRKDWTSVTFVQVGFDSESNERKKFKTAGYYIISFFYIAQHILLFFAIHFNAFRLKYYYHPRRGYVMVER